ncbi:MAG: PIN domain-containing protein [Bacillota bacterium]
MKVLIDTNIVLDVLLNRKPFVKNALKVFRQAEKGRIEAYITASSVTDLVYILRKAYSLTEIKKHLNEMFQFIRITGITPSMITGALGNSAPDFEDAVMMECARQSGMEIIITRNRPDFKNSYVPCISLEEWAKEQY